MMCTFGRNSIALPAVYFPLSIPLSKSKLINGSPAHSSMFIKARAITTGHMLLLIAVG